MPIVGGVTVPTARLGATVVADAEVIGGSDAFSEALYPSEELYPSETLFPGGHVVAASSTVSEVAAAGASGLPGSAAGVSSVLTQSITGSIG